LKNATLILLLFLTASTLFGQSEIDLSRDFIYKGEQYSPNSPWLSVGIGYGYNISENTWEPNFLFDTHFRIKKKFYLGVGFATSRNQFLDKDGNNIFLPHSFVKNSVNNIHIMYGWRKIGLKNNYAFFLGPSFNWGYDYIYSDSTGDYHKKYTEPGFYTSLQYTRKIYYDLGLGLTLWSSLNKSYQIIGLTLHIYFSSAFKRKII
jgi:hypothetical protein